MSDNLICKVALRGDALLIHPRFNKGTAFTEEERNAFSLNGRLPFRVNTLDEQCARAYDQFLATDVPIRQNSFLQSLKEQNWVLYYALITRHLRKMIPIIYTPTEVCVMLSFMAPDDR
jgi:malate dehydrogenase (oxaloacetate-decarboxylating)